jgi:hypothetical protein
LTQYFDTIPHSELMQSVARRVSDRQMLALIKSWLKVPVEERDDRGNRRMTGGKKSRRGTPQGGDSGLGELLQLREPSEGPSGGRSLRRSGDAPFSQAMPQGADARHSTLSKAADLRCNRSPATADGRRGSVCVCPDVTPVGEPYAGNPHVRFDERGWETESRSELRHRRDAKAAGNGNSSDLRPPRPSSTLHSGRPAPNTQIGPIIPRRGSRPQPRIEPPAGSLGVDVPEGG